jgi:hypothetical protein
MENWTDNTITINSQYMFSKGEKLYKFPKKVFGPECSQNDVFNYLKPLSDSFLASPGRNVFMMAYGQTGTGKTHTIFGPRDAALSESTSDEWGIFPKVTDAVFKTMTERGVKF